MYRKDCSRQHSIRRFFGGKLARDQYARDSPAIGTPRAVAAHAMKNSRNLDQSTCESSNGERAPCDLPQLTFAVQQLPDVATGKVRDQTGAMVQVTITGDRPPWGGSPGMCSGAPPPLLERPVFG
jgi:hypothetical protein